MIVFSVLRLSDTPGLGPVSSVTYHLEDNGILSVVGERVLKLLKLNDKLLKTWGYQGGHNHNCQCQVWADQHTLLVGTDVASVLLLEEGELRAEIRVTHSDLGPECDKKTSGEGVAALGGRGLGPRHRRVTALKVFVGGFLCACGPDKVFVFQKSDDVNEHYFQVARNQSPNIPSQRYMLRICEPSPAALVSGRGEHTITTLSLSPGEKNIVAATHTRQLFTNPLPSLEAAKLPSLMFSPLHARHHEGGVVDADGCLWKTIVVSGGQDRTVRVWDYQEHSLLLTHAFREDIFSLSLHPTGLHVAVGLTDALRLHHVLFDCLRPYSEIRIRRCGVCSFSPSGYLLAAADGNLLVITSNVSLRKIFTLKGHSAKVTGIGWYPDSSAAMTCAADGTVVGWDANKGQSIWEVSSLTSSNYLTWTLSLDGKPTVVVGHGSSFTEITGGQVSFSNLVLLFSIFLFEYVIQMVQDITYEPGDLTCAGLSPVKTLVTLGSTSGQLVVNKYPLHMAQKFTAFPAHSGSLNKVLVTGDESKVVTCGADGVILVWRVAALEEDSPGYLAARERLEDLPRVPEMLVTRTDLQIKKTRHHLEELERRVSYLSRDKEVHLGLQQQEFAASRDALCPYHLVTSPYRDALVARYQTIVDQMNDTIQTLEKEREQLKDGHKDSLAKLAEEHSNVMADHQQELRKKLLYEYSKQDKLEAKLKEMQQTLDRQVEEAEKRTRLELQERLDQQEGVVEQLKMDLEKTTAELERERSEGAEIVRLVEAATEAELGQVRSSLHAQLAEEHQNVIRLRSEMAAMRKNFVTVQREREQKEEDLRALTDDKAKLQSSIRGLERELAALRREVNHRDDIIHDRESKITNTRERIGELEKQRFLLDHQLGQLKEELEPLQAALDQRSQQIKQADSMGEEAVPELLRQREMLERSVATLRAQAQKQARASKDRITTLVKENSDLLSSVKTLESRSWRLEEDLRQAESMAGLRDPRSGRRKASRDLLVQTVTRQADTIARLQDQIRTLQENQRKGEGGDEDDQTGDAKPKPVESEDVDGAKQSIVPQEEPAAVPAATA
ncbi:cilia- and flagella-associated protein 57-like [Penaeus monodon]|uniref:cilia- and flagella-associated protein 57-like n=1 Tax=Penaeus monodon TaxID=6687 RepID=UPI0018A7721B|nr:cilia- and flagella-associated protein 57-like [Penaeus monodon]